MNLNLSRRSHQFLADLQPKHHKQVASRLWHLAKDPKPNNIAISAGTLDISELPLASTESSTTWRMTWCTSQSSTPEMPTPFTGS